MADSVNQQTPAGYKEQGINPDTMIPLSLRYGIVTVSLSFAILRYPSSPAQYVITGKVLNMRIKASK